MQQMQIQGTEIQIKEYQGKRVVTLKDVDAVHQRKPGTASRNFNQNRNRFIEDIDFFRINVTDNEIRSQFGISPQRWWNRNTYHRNRLSDAGEVFHG